MVCLNSEIVVISGSSSILNLIQIKLYFQPLEILLISDSQLFKTMTIIMQQYLKIKVPKVGSSLCMLPKVIACKQEVIVL